jgi:hypothetical protein
MIHSHEDMAGTALTAAAIMGVLALGALIKWRRTPIPRGAAAVMVAGSLVVCGLMGYTGLLGGRIRHTEVRPGATAADAMVVEPPRTRAPITR